MASVERQDADGCGRYGLARLEPQALAYDKPPAGALRA